ncbi:citrate synthase-like protein [Xylogone sp. PMI_703]|nr:citrate synthase-like protein [Xylogone sp. PMI_703]
MPMILAGLAAYIGCDPEFIPASNGGNIYHGNQEKVGRAIIRTVAAYGVCIGLAASHKKGIKPTPASPDKTYFENIFNMMGHVDPMTGQPDPRILSCFRRFAVLNTDHGMTQSTFVLLATASSLPDPISCLISALAAAYGPLHFGATESAYKVIEKVGKPENVPALIDEVKRGERRLFGYGHRTYKTIDPRLAPIKELLVELDAGSNPLLRVAQEIDRIAAKDEYFTKRGLNANADFYGVFFFIAW